MPPTKPETEAEKMSVNRLVGLWQHTHTEKIKEERNEIEGRIEDLPLFICFYASATLLFQEGRHSFFAGNCRAGEIRQRKKDLHDVWYIASLGNTQILLGIA